MKEILLTVTLLISMSTFSSEVNCDISKIKVGQNITLSDDEIRDELGKSGFNLENAQVVRSNSDYLQPEESPAVIRISSIQWNRIEQQCQLQDQHTSDPVSISYRLGYFFRDMKCRLYNVRAERESRKRAKRLGLAYEQTSNKIYVGYKLLSSEDLDGHQDYTKLSLESLLKETSCY